MLIYIVIFCDYTTFKGRWRYTKIKFARIFENRKEIVYESKRKDVIFKPLCVYVS